MEKLSDVNRIGVIRANRSRERSVMSSPVDSRRQWLGPLTKALGSSNELTFFRTHSNAVYCVIKFALVP